MTEIIKEIVNFLHPNFGGQYAILPLLIAQGAISAYEIINSAIQKKKAENELAKLQHPNYTVSPELQDAYSKSLEMSKYGYSPSQRASFRSNVGQDINTQTANALAVGGGQLGRTINRMGQVAKLGAENKFAFDDASLMDRHILNSQVVWWHWKRSDRQRGSR